MQGQSHKWPIIGLAMGIHPHLLAGQFWVWMQGAQAGRSWGPRLLKANLTSFQRNCQLPLHLCLLLSHANELSLLQLKPRQHAALRAAHVFVRLAGGVGLWERGQVRRADGRQGRARAAHSCATVEAEVLASSYSGLC